MKSKYKNTKYPCNVGLITTLSTSINISYPSPIISIDIYPDKIIENVMKYINQKLNNNGISVIGNSKDPLSSYYNRKIIELSNKYNYEILNKRCSNKNVYFIFYFLIEF